MDGRKIRFDIYNGWADEKAPLAGEKFILDILSDDIDGLLYEIETYLEDVISEMIGEYKDLDDEELIDVDNQGREIL